MNSVVIVGAQWGDEGKGKITDFLAAQAGLVVRCQGGNNAGHTVVNGSEVYKLHLAPAGILYPGTGCVIGNGVVLDLEALLQEIDELTARGVDCAALKISERAHLILPYHRQLDMLQEKGKAKQRIGTTGRGIGPAYMDKAARDGLRLIDLLNFPRFSEQLRHNLREKACWFQESGLPLPDEQELLARYEALAKRIRPYVADTASIINRALDAGQKVLFEGAQGALLDVDHGTYPFVTSSNSTAGGACTGAGVGPTKIGRVLGVLKAYSTRVGDGPFPSELPAPAAERLRELGGEYGVTTGRPRRCGWLDMVALRYAAMISGFTDMAVTKLDVLDSFAEIEVCTAYRMNGRLIEDFPADISGLAACEPVYEKLPGWQADTSACRSYEELPKNAQHYIAYLEAALKAPVSIVSVGASREYTLVRKPLFL